MENVPPENIDQLPTDGAEQHDHYIYGTPKHEQGKYRNRSGKSKVDE